MATELGAFRDLVSGLGAISLCLSQRRVAVQCEAGNDVNWVAGIGRRDAAITFPDWVTASDWQESYDSSICLLYSGR